MKERRLPQSERARNRRKASALAGAAVVLASMQVAEPTARAVARVGHSISSGGSELSHRVANVVKSRPPRDLVPSRDDPDFERKINEGLESGKFVKVRTDPELNLNTVWDVASRLTDGNVGDLNDALVTQVRGEAVPYTQLVVPATAEAVELSRQQFPDEHSKGRL